MPKRKKPSDTHAITTFFTKKSRSDESAHTASTPVPTTSNSSEAEGSSLSLIPRASPTPSTDHGDDGESSHSTNPDGESSHTTNPDGESSHSTNPGDAGESSCSTNPDEGESPVECDVGKLQATHVDLKKLSRENKYRLLKTEPPANKASYPRTRPFPSSTLRQFQPSWMPKYPWLHYSKFVDGAFCRACVLFAPSQAGGTDLCQFVTSPFKSWTTVTAINRHASRQYHLDAMTKMEEFVDRFENPSQSVDTLLSDEARQVFETNEKVIESLLKIVILCGKQGLALRGHRDDGIHWERDEGRLNEGNFIQLVRFRAETDTILANHLAKSPRNARYTSKSIQNELVGVVGDSIRHDIIREVKNAKYYSIIADEVTDVSNKEELSLVLRYVYNREIREVFVDFLEVERITGRVLGEAILQWLERNEISPVDMRGQCYDGASNMSGACSGVKSVVQEAAPKAMYYHCAAHRLNLSVVSACRIQSFKNAESYLGEIARFFNNSAKRQRLLEKAIEACTNSTTSAKKLKDACKTRWVERIDSYAVFLELLPATHMSLEAMVHPHLHSELGSDWSWDGETLTKAKGFLFQLQSSSFLVSFQILVQVLHILREVTVKLQSKAIDVVQAYKMVQGVVATLKSMRRESSTEFRKQFAEATKIGKKLHGEEFELSKPRISGRMSHRSNPPSSTPEDYYRITLYDEFLSHVVSELEDRFVNNPSHKIAIGLLHLVPSECVLVEDDVSVPEDLTEAVELFEGDLPHAVMFTTEYGLWVRKWKGCSTTIPDTLVGALEECSTLTFPNVSSLLNMALTLPITSCESERSFSQLKLVKTARRSTMSESRLSSLALMKINRDRCTKLSSDPEHIKQLIRSFAQLHPRRMKLSFMLGDD